jgi:hypothetical protein
MPLLRAGAHRGADLLDVHAEPAEDLPGRALHVEDAQEQVDALDLIRPLVSGEAGRPTDGSRAPIGAGERGAPVDGAGSGHRFSDLASGHGERRAGVLEQGLDVGIGEQAEQQVLGPDPIVAQVTRLALRGHDGPPGTEGEPLEVVVDGCAGHRPSSCRGSVDRVAAINSDV